MASYRSYWHPAALPGVPGSSTGASTDGGTAGTAADFSQALGEIPNGVGAFAPPGDPGDDERAISASYARARDRAGLEAKGAADSIRALMARRGLSGSKFGLSQEAKGVKHGLNRLGEYSRDEAMALARRRQSVADRNYAGALTARGQDLSAQSTRTNQALSLYTLRARMQQEQDALDRASEEAALDRSERARATRSLAY